MSRQTSEFQEKSMSLIYRGKEIFKPLNTGCPDREQSAVYALGVARPNQRGFHAAAVSLLGLVVAER